MDSKQVAELSSYYLFQNYGRETICFSHGQGEHLWDLEGNRYTDYVAGIAVNCLGHAHPELVRAISEQAAKLIHVSNLYQIREQADLGEALASIAPSPLGRSLFCNSGAEANEAAIKLARKYMSEQMPGHYELITLHNSFHGRTLTTVTATAQERFHVGFAPLPEGFRYVPYNNLQALEEAITEKTCGVMVEPIQGESGVVLPAPGYLQGIRSICDEKGLLMIADEVQTGIGRTGTLFACEQEKVVPDIITSAKALGNGFPIGACLAKEKIASAFGPGTHGSTFGGNPLACAAALATLETILNANVLENCRKVGEYFLSRLSELQDKHFQIKEVRGRGLMLAVELSIPGAGIVSDCMGKGLLINCTNENVLRFVPPLIITKQDVDKAIGILDESFVGK